MKDIQLPTKKLLSALAVVILLLFWCLIGYYIGKPMIRFAEQPERFRSWVENGGIASRLVFVGMVIIQVIVAIIPGEPLELGAGYAFGAIEGAILCLIGCFLGGIIVFALVRSVGVTLVEVFFPIEKIRSLHFLKNQRKVNVLTYLIFILPGTPKDLLSYFVGLTDMRWGTWLIITGIARIPSIITSTYCGSAAGAKNYVVAIVALIVTACISLIGWLIYQYICKKHENNDTE